MEAVEVEDSWSRTARIIRTAGFGATGAEVDAVHSRGVSTWLAESLAGERFAEAPPGRPDLDVDPKDKEAAKKAVKALVTWWVGVMVSTATPVTEKVIWGWHDHFATSVHKVKNAGLMARQLQTLRTHAVGGFDELAVAMITDPALMIWLDAEKNTASHPNENLAREFLELFTIGHGNGYTEQDIREGARALSGWRVNRSGETRLMPARADLGTKTVLGVTGPIDTGEFARLAATHPATAGHVVTRWWNRWAAPGAVPPSARQEMTEAYGESRDVGALLRALLLGADFAQATATHVVCPLEWMVASLRTLRVAAEEKQIAAAAGALRQLAQVPLDPPDVAGWPVGRAWLSTSAHDIRRTIVARLVKVGDLSPVADAAPESRVDALAHLLGVDGFSPRTRAALALGKGDPTHLVSVALISPEYLVI